MPAETLISHVFEVLRYPVNIEDLDRVCGRGRRIRFARSDLSRRSHVRRPAFSLARLTDGRSNTDRQEADRLDRHLFMYVPRKTYAISDIVNRVYINEAGRPLLA